MITFIGGALIAGAISGGLLGVIAWSAFASTAEARVAERVVVAIQAGTGDRLARGDVAGSSAGAAGLPPSAVRLATGDTLVLRNDDGRAHRVGAYTIAPGAILELAVTAADSGTFQCSFNAAGRFSLDVVPPLQPATVILPAILIGLPVGGVAGLVGWIARAIGEPDVPMAE